jgi:ABC-type branched-subunit amino acid transport system substrate-binding protein
MKKMFIVLVMVLGFVLLISAIERGAVGQAKKEPIKIGLLIEKTGGLAAYGYSHERVMVAAVNKVNKEGGIYSIIY